MLRRLHPIQPASFAFSPANHAWAEGQIAKYPPGRQASAIIPLLWRAQEQEGWLSRPAIEHVAAMLGMAYIRALEVATFYFMFQLAPVGRIAHVQVCGTLSCMICGAEDLIAVCKRKIARSAHTLSADGNFSWEEVECLGACANAPMVQIGKDYYEDLTVERLEWILDELAAGRVPPPGPQNGRFAAEPLGGATTLKAPQAEGHNASVARALAWGDTVKRIDGTEAPVLTAAPRAKPDADAKPVSTRLGKAPVPKAPDPGPLPTEAPAGSRPAALPAARDGRPDDLKRIKGVGPKLEALLNGLGFFHFDQVAGWTAAELAWVDANLEGFKGRASRDDWVAQARILAAGGETEFSGRQGH
jgi:NADH-quinone oxidoreductase subunit E